MATRKEHWDSVYAAKAPRELTWFREHLDTSLRMIRNTGAVKDAAIIDVGGGNSTLVDDLLEGGSVDVSVLDISSKAISDSKERVGERGDDVEWIVADITKIELPPDRYDIWHDRAVFHFLTDDEDRRRYVDLVMRSLKRGGHIIVASFSLDGPQKCSGLDVMRYSPETMHDEFGDTFRLVESIPETHIAPSGKIQDFVYCYCRKV
jgi:ubiquinone/menaquinone biosynthesis C-methylase UbiE